MRICQRGRLLCFHSIFSGMATFLYYPILFLHSSTVFAQSVHSTSISHDIHHWAFIAVMLLIKTRMVWSLWVFFSQWLSSNVLLILFQIWANILLCNLQWEAALWKPFLELLQFPKTSTSVTVLFFTKISFLRRLLLDLGSIKIYRYTRTLGKKSIWDPELCG